MVYIGKEHCVDSKVDNKDGRDQDKDKEPPYLVLFVIRQVCLCQL